MENSTTPQPSSFLALITVDIWQRSQAICREAREARQRSQAKRQTYQ